MNFQTLLRYKIMPALRNVFGENKVSAMSVALYPGVSLTIKGGDRVDCMFAIRENDLGFNLTCSVQNVNVQNEYYFTEDPLTLIHLITKYAKENKDMPIEGRTIMKFEELERELGTLTGVDAESMVNGDDEDDLSDAIELEPRTIA